MLLQRIPRHGNHSAATTSPTVYDAACGAGKSGAASTFTVESCSVEAMIFFPSRVTQMSSRGPSNQAFALHLRKVLSDRSLRVGSSANSMPHLF
jgi:hypothetical protein